MPQKAQELEKRADDVIQSLKVEELINLSTLGREAQVPFAWLYQNELMKRRIEQLKTQSQKHKEGSTPECLTDPSCMVFYNRLIGIMKFALILLCAYVEFSKGKCTGLSMIYSTSLMVCHNNQT